MALGRQMHDGVGLVVAEDALDSGRSQMSTFSNTARVAIDDAAQRIGMRRIGHLVQADDRRVGVAQQMAANGRTDEARGTSDDDLHRTVPNC